MAQIIALTMQVPQRLALTELLRTMIVIGCAMALIAAGQAYPF
jgi:hypothetical protein